jgi:glucosamine-6-phosphate deaminase
VWYRFRLSECTLIAPESLNSLSMTHTAFMNCFGSQSAASFPSHEHDGPFSELAQRIQVEQYRQLETCLGSDFFQKNSHPRLRAARGMIYLAEMELDHFFDTVRDLKKKQKIAEHNFSLLHPVPSCRHNYIWSFQRNRI